MGVWGTSQFHEKRKNQAKSPNGPKINATFQAMKQSQNIGLGEANKEI